MVRSAAFFGVNTFIELYWIRHLHTGRGLAGVALNVPFAVLVKLGQDYLPGRPGTAAGVTLGLGVSIGGLFAPLLGLAAQHYGPQGVFTILCAVPLVAFAGGLLLREPLPARLERSRFPQDPDAALPPAHDRHQDAGS